ncbi:E3 ubiquitin-protein ligase RNF135 isoform X2 [Sphaerodactylus townsendi]|uniref:E3 ubiquitin-protein ligase RNF135 isoform X2 n=1 Tax=Sphaerodactylus townsendi TaxID=933632 RepID=UPI0020274475|nr:E3 ubiquitin-protein ligase RNF135 isoform X2 [Sphaerodactylus townsendi]
MASSAGDRRVAVWLKADDLRCSVCLELLASPATLSCGHSFCLGCLRRWAEAREGRERSCPNCQRPFRKQLPDRNVLLELVLEPLRRAAGQGQPLPDEVKISEISAQVDMVVEAVTRMRKNRTEMKDYVSRIRTSITEDFAVMKKYINDQEQMVLEVLDQECRVAEQKIDEVVQQLTARLDHLLELQTNSEELMKNVLSEQTISVGSSPAIEKVELDDQKIDSVARAVKKLTRLLEMPVLENCPRQMLQATEPSLEASGTSEILMELKECTIATSSNSTHHQDTYQDTRGCPSSMDSNGDSSMPVISSQFSPWASDVTFDHERIHDYLELTKDKRRVTVSKYSCEYKHSTKRFRNSQVMGSPGFSEGCHYWEVNTRGSIGWAIGVAVGEMGNCDQLGRTELSWCVEWTDGKLSAWHEGQETGISEERPLRVGTFLNIPQNCVSFYSCTDKETFLHRFEIKKDSLVYPAFWIYGVDPGNFLTIGNITMS